ncbi:MAG: hypothetical protein L3K19_08385 [Thermoplasmata archaeon]|nr:hypothetical protein [Thermoplasmata archaeon]
MRPVAAGSELVPWISTIDAVARNALMQLPRLRSWDSVVEELVRHRDWKYAFGPGGRAIRKHLWVREKNLAGLGKEPNRVENARVIGLKAAGGRAKTYVDPDPFKGSASEVAERLGVSRRRVFRRRRTPNRRARVPRGPGGFAGRPPTYG